MQYKKHIKIMNFLTSALSQIGRQVVRNATTKVLKKSDEELHVVDYFGEISSSDSPLVRSIKQINKTTLVISNKSNVIKLLDLSISVIKNLQFEGYSSLNELYHYKMLIEVYDRKVADAYLLIDDSYYENKSFEYFKQQDLEIIKLKNKFNCDLSDYIKANLHRFTESKRSRKVAILLAFWGLGLQWFYLRSFWLGVISVLLCFTVVIPILNFIAFLSLIIMGNNDFNERYNKEFCFYNEFEIEKFLL